MLATAAVALLPSLRGALGLSQEQADAYRPGEQIDVPSSVYSEARQTLVLFVRASCAACQNAVPVLSQLVSGLKSTDTKITVISPMLDRSQQVAYVGLLGLDESDVLQHDLRRMRLRVVPTAVLVSREGNILHVAEGADALAPFAEEVLARVRRR